MIKGSRQTVVPLISSTSPVIVLFSAIIRMVLASSTIEWICLAIFPFDFIYSCSYYALLCQLLVGVLNENKTFEK